MRDVTFCLVTLAVAAHIATATAAESARVSRQDTAQFDELAKIQPPEQVPPGEPIGAARNRESEARPDAWRYQRRQGRWWYYAGPGKWLWWDGASWQRPRPAGSKEGGAVANFSGAASMRRRAALRSGAIDHEHHGWVGGFYSSGGGYGDPAFGYGYGVPTYGPYQPR